MKKILKFLLAGLPAFGVALLLNYVLVRQLEMSKPVAYVLVLVVQIGINFFACRYLVFKVHPTLNLWQSFGRFFYGIILFRIADWGLYVLLATKIGLPFLAVQLFNVALFSLLKYEFSRKIFEQPK